MGKNLTRIVALLLVPCLLVDPSLAASIHFVPISIEKNNAIPIFSENALAPQPAVSERVIEGAAGRLGFDYRRKAGAFLFLSAAVVLTAAISMAQTSTPPATKLNSLPKSFAST